MDTSDYIAAGALVASLLSMLLSVRGYYLSKRALVIAETDHQDKNRDIMGYLIDSFRWEKDGKFYASFSLSYTNNATHSNSFKDVSLEIEYYSDKKIFSKLKLSPSVGAFPVGLSDGWEDLKLPINLSPRETRSGWITFQIPVVEGQKMNIEVYRVMAVSGLGSATMLESYILKSVESGNG
ncbi:hypothetical protein N7365_06860 [Pseudomonas sediminis]|uniref:hypothetical protein n=1 Tax=Pseudomonas sediminis TaxID=1691904 RepID=UPI00244B2146|nr:MULTISPECIES: hypothetical protein [Pseudomonas]MDG9757816.1 hypothetical protein [Pseudomonas sediminis]MDH1623197.1 hypothetical protein [Pseudomonas chengduensis]